MRLASLCILVLVALTGCRDYVVNPVEPADAPPSDVRTAYIKGPAELTVGAQTEYKAERFELARYDWRLRGPVTLESVDDGTRFLESIATQPGAATLEVLVFDERSGELIARGSRPIQVVTL